MEAGDADEAPNGPRPRRSGAEPDRITRFASPNRFDSLDAPVSFLDRRASPGGGGNGSNGNNGANLRGSTRANVDAITRGAVPERCISSDLLIGSRTGQAYRTSHSATLVPSRTSATQSLPTRNRSANKKKQASLLLDGTGTMPRPNSQTRPESTIRLSKLTASVQRLLADREAERQAISRQQFELQIGRSGSEGCVREPAVRPSLASKAQLTPSAGNRTPDGGSGSGWSSSDKFEPVHISQELVNDFFSSPLADSPGYGDFALAVANSTRSEEQAPGIGVKIPPGNSAEPPATPTSLPSPHSVALEDSHPEISKLDAKVRTRNVIHTGVATTAKRLSLTNRARHTLSLELPPEHVPLCEAQEIDEGGAKAEARLSNGGGGGGGGGEGGGGEEAVEEEDPEYVRQLDELAGRMGLVQRRPSARRSSDAPKLADESYREATAARHMSAPEPTPAPKNKKSHRRTLSSGSGLLASFWRHFSPRLSRRGRQSLAAESSGGARQPSRSDSATPAKSKNEPEWDSLSSSSQKQRPASESSCPSPNNVFSNASSSEFVQPTVNRQVMASIERDRIRDPYQSFKSRAQQQQQQQQQQASAESPVLSRPSQLSINSPSTPSSTASAPRLNSSSKAAAPESPGASSLSSPGPRYINVSLAAYGYGLPYRTSSREQVADGEADDAPRNPQDRLSCPASLDDEGAEGATAAPKAVNGTGPQQPELSNGLSETEQQPAEAKMNGSKEEAGTRTPRPATLPTDGSTSPVARRRAKTIPRGATPSSPLNRSFDAQTAARSSLIMLAVGHASPRPKSVSVSAAESEGGLEEATRPDSEDEAAGEAKDGRHFLRTVDQTEREIRSCIAATEADLAASGALMNDEVSGILRTAIGKATLLVTDKFAQFRGLCEQNLAANAATPYATRSSDLEGFWEMVGLQVADVRRMFQEIRQLRDNGWRLPEKPAEATPPPPPPPQQQTLSSSSSPRKAPRRPATAPTGAKRSSGAASAAREEARKRLLAAKREAMAKKKAAAAAADPEPDVIFVS